MKTSTRTISIAFFLLGFSSVSLSQSKEEPCSCLWECFDQVMYEISDVEIKEIGGEDEWAEYAYQFTGTVMWGWDPIPDEESGVQLIYRITMAEGNPNAISW